MASLSPSQAISQGSTSLPDPYVAWRTPTPPQRSIHSSPSFFKKNPKNNQKKIPKKGFKGWQGETEEVPTSLAKRRQRWLDCSVLPWLFSGKNSTGGSFSLTLKGARGINDWMPKNSNENVQINLISTDNTKLRSSESTINTGFRIKTGCLRKKYTYAYRYLNIQVNEEGKHRWFLHSQATTGQSWAVALSACSAPDSRSRRCSSGGAHATSPPASCSALLETVSQES